MFPLFQDPPVSLLPLLLPSLTSFLLPSSPLKSPNCHWADFWVTLCYYHWPSSEPHRSVLCPSVLNEWQVRKPVVYILVYIVCTVLPPVNKDDCHMGDLSDPALYPASQPTGRIPREMFSSLPCRQTYPLWGCIHAAASLHDVHTLDWTHWY